MYVTGVMSLLPTVQILTVSGTYTPAVGCTHLKVYIIGGGAGGSGGGATSVVGGGGGPGKVLMVHLLPAVYSYSIGPAGLAGPASTVGGAGGTTTFAGFSAGGGTTSPVVTPFETGTTSFVDVPGTTRLGISPAGGSSQQIEASGNGGASLFGRNGRGAHTTVAGYTGENGLSIGGGGGGGNISSAGGAGAAGGVVVIEYYY